MTQRITDVEAHCPSCAWRGTIGGTESGDDGECQCPECGVEAKETTGMDKMRWSIEGHGGEVKDPESEPVAKDPDWLTGIDDDNDPFPERCDDVGRRAPQTVDTESWRTHVYMPFGKHKGEDVGGLPLGYVTWVLENVDIYSEDLEWALKNTYRTKTGYDFFKSDSAPVIGSDLDDVPF